MSLLGNYSVLNRTPGKFISGGIAQNRSNSNTSGSDRGANYHFGRLAAKPSGYYAPYAWSLPQIIGEMSSFTYSYGVATPSVNLAGGINADASALLSIVATNAQLDQIVEFLASSLLTLSVTSAVMNAAVSAQASSVLSITGAANVGAIVDALASSSMSITSNSILTALAYMDAEAGGPTPLSPEGLAQAVWDSLSSDYSTTGTIGELMNEIKAEVVKKLDKGMFIALK